MEIKNTIYLLVCAAVLLCAWGSVCCAQDQTSAQADSAQQPTIVLEAPVISLDGTDYSAEGSAVLHSGNIRITAESLHYDSDTKGIRASDASITTCTHNPPHYKLDAGSISLSENGWLDAHKLSVKLGQTRIFYLPWIKLHFSKQGGSRTYWPMVWYDDEGGISLSKSFAVWQNDRLESKVKAKLSQRSNFETVADLNYGIDGRLKEMPGRELSNEYFGPNSLFLLRSARESIAAQDTQPAHKTSRLRGYVNYMLNHTVDDIDETDVKVLMRPEIGLKYTMRPIGYKADRLDRALLLSPVVDVSWAEMKEKPSVYGNIERGKVNISTAFSFLDTGEKSAIQPVISQTWYKYSSLRDFQVFAYGLDIARIYRSGADVNIRYLNRSSKGLKVFESDDVDVRQELQFATNLYQHGHKYSFGAAYDMDKQHLFEWETRYGYETDCIDIGVSYNYRLRRIGFDLEIKGL